MKQQTLRWLERRQSDNNGQYIVDFELSWHIACVLNYWSVHLITNIYVNIFARKTKEEKYHYEFYIYEKVFRISNPNLMMLIFVCKWVKETFHFMYLSCRHISKNSTDAIFIWETIVGTCVLITCWDNAMYVSAMFFKRIKKGGMLFFFGQLCVYWNVSYLNEIKSYIF
jgi:hypothetical protein